MSLRPANAAWPAFESVRKGVRFKKVPGTTTLIDQDRRS